MELANFMRNISAKTKLSNYLYPLIYKIIARQFSFPTEVNILMVISHFQVGILKRVLEEVEKVMNEFKNMLYKSMEDPQIDLTNVRLFCTFWFLLTICW